MFSVNKVTLWTMTGLLAITTIIFNVYTFIMSLLNCRQKKHWCASDIIIMALSVASVIHQLLCYLFMTFDEVDSICSITYIANVVTLLIIFSLKFTIMWDTSFLTFFYSTKLVSTPNHCYTKIQAAILKHVNLVILVIPLCGLGTCMPMLLVFNPDNHTTIEKDCEALIPNSHSGRIYEIIYLLFSDIVPGILMVKCCISISVHLAIHLHHMKASTNGAHCPKLGSQMRVIQMALALVVIFAIFLGVDLYVHYQICVYQENVLMLTFFFTSVYTTVTAVVLIYGKKSLWKALIHDFNACLEKNPYLSCLQLPEEKAKTTTPTKVKN
ncbi:taste receptor, type 2, member 202 [Mastacembelus armatus]|nr:uncharacterized protein LOC113138542 [Mastacembelus armatus]